MTNLNNLTPEQIEVIESWLEDGAASACRDIDAVIRFLIQPVREDEPKEILRMLQNLLAIRHELEVFNSDRKEA